MKNGSLDGTFLRVMAQPHKRLTSRSMGRRESRSHLCAQNAQRLIG